MACSNESEEYKWSYAVMRVRNTKYKRCFCKYEAKIYFDLITTDDDRSSGSKYECKDQLLFNT